MTRATKQNPVSDRPEADIIPATESGRPTPAETALHLAQIAAVGVARGTGSVARTGGAMGAYLLGQGFALARTALEQRRKVPVAALVDEKKADAAPRSRRVRRLVVFGGLTAAVAAGVAVWRLRRPQPAPVAERPPSVRDVEAPSAPETAQSS